MNESLPTDTPLYSAEVLPAVQMNARLHEVWSDVQNATASPETQEQLYAMWRTETENGLDPEERDDFGVASDIIHWSMFPHAHDELPKGLVYLHHNDGTWSVTYASPRAKWALNNTVLQSDSLFSKDSGSVYAQRLASYRYNTKTGNDFYEALENRIEEMPVMRLLRSLDVDGQETQERPLNHAEQLAMRSALEADTQRRFGALTNRAQNPMAARQHYANESLIEESRVAEQANAVRKEPQQAMRALVARIIESERDPIIVDQRTINIGAGMNDGLSITAVGKRRNSPDTNSIAEIEISDVAKALMQLSETSPRNRILSVVFEEAIAQHIPDLLEAAPGPDAQQKYRRAVDAIKRNVRWRLSARLRPDNLKDLVGLNSKTILFDTMPPGEVIDEIAHANRHSTYERTGSVVSQFVPAEQLTEAASRVKARFMNPPQENIFMMTADANAMHIRELSSDAIAPGRLVVNAQQPYSIPGYELLGWVCDNEAYIYQKSKTPTVPAKEAMRLDKKSLTQHFSDIGAKEAGRMFKRYSEPTIVDLVEVLKANSVYATPDGQAKRSLDPENKGFLFDGSRFITQCTGMATHLSELLRWQGYDAKPVSGYGVGANTKVVSARNSHAVVEVMLPDGPYYFDATPNIASSDASQGQDFIEQRPRLRDALRSMLGSVALKLRRTQDERPQHWSMAVTDLLGNPVETMLSPTPSLSKETEVEHTARPELSVPQKQKVLNANRTQCETYLAGYFGAADTADLHRKIAAATRQGNQEAVIAQRVLHVIARSAPRFEGAEPVSHEEISQLQAALERLYRGKNLPLKYHDMSRGLLAGLQNSLDKVAESVATEV